MTQKRGGLGKNLSALLGQSALQVKQDTRLLEHVQIEYRPIASLTPGQYQPRRAFDEATIKELANSIQQQGLLQPLVVRELKPGQYEIIAGERRWRACKLAGLTQIPVLIRQVDDEAAIALALVENLQREDLSALDQARAMQRLMTDFGLTHQQIATLLSKSRTAVSNYVRLLNLTTEVQTLLEQGALDMGHARSLLTLSAEDQHRVALTVVAKELSVRDTERLVAEWKIKKQAALKPKVSYPQALQPQLEAMAQRLQTAVKLKPGAEGQGMLLIHYSDLDFLEQMMTHILDGSPQEI
ncbi:MAG: ParB/RepB/Spo0J family partition protein [Gammaproteobacteria bacterium]|nr:ParB/RepB/Spo0J family partition protein [Gammaproteobacteria bacterium]